MRQQVNTFSTYSDMKKISVDVRVFDFNATSKFIPFALIKQTGNYVLSITGIYSF